MFDFYFRCPECQENVGINIIEDMEVGVCSCGKSISQEVGTYANIVNTQKTCTCPICDRQVEFMGANFGFSEVECQCGTVFKQLNVVRWVDELGNSIPPSQKIIRLPDNYDEVCIYSFEVEKFLYTGAEMPGEWWSFQTAYYERDVQIYDDIWDAHREFIEHRCDWVGAVAFVRRAECVEKDGKLFPPSYILN